MRGRLQKEGEVIHIHIICDQTINPPYEVGTLSADVGEDLAYSPHNRFTATASYALPLDPAIGQIVFGATYSYTSAQFAVAQTVSDPS